MAYVDDVRLLVKIARLYYEDGATQAEIADLIGLSRPLISKSLQKAREKGIVQVTIHDELSDSNTYLERQLEQSFSLKEAVVVPDAPPDQIKRRLGAAASEYFLRIVKPGWTVAVSWGTTLAEFAAAMPYTHLEGVTVVSAVGGTSEEKVEFLSNRIASNLSEKLSGHCVLFHAPVFFDSPDAKKMFLEQKSVRKVVEFVRHANMLVVGIGGSPAESTMVRHYVNQEEQHKIAAAGAVGDICSVLFDKDGNPISHYWNECVMTVGFDDLRKIPLVLGITSGTEKTQAIFTALKAHLIDALVTDVSTATAVLGQ